MLGWEARRRNGLHEQGLCEEGTDAWGCGWLRRGTVAKSPGHHPHWGMLIFSKQGVTTRALLGQQEVGGKSGVQKAPEELGVSWNNQNKPQVSSGYSKATLSHPSSVRNWMQQNWSKVDSESSKMVTQRVKISQLSNASPSELAETGTGRGQSPNCKLRHASQVESKLADKFDVH